MTVAEMLRSMDNMREPIDRNLILSAHQADALIAFVTRWEEWRFCGDCAYDLPSHAPGCTYAAFAAAILGAITESTEQVGGEIVWLRATVTKLVAERDALRTKLAVAEHDRDEFDGARIALIEENQDLRELLAELDEYAVAHPHGRADISSASTSPHPSSPVPSK